MLRRAGLWLARGAAALLSLFLLAFVFQVWEMGRSARLMASLDGSKDFCREGARWSTCNPMMIRRSFSAEKGKDVFRAFVVGSSQAMGSPYVYQEMNAISRLFPNEGGISTWLVDYLSAVHPDKKVEVVNAAKGSGAQMSEHLRTFRELLRIGSPDLVVVLAGNNEFPPGWEPVPAGTEPRQARSPQALREGVAAIGRRYEEQAKELARLADEAGVRVYLLTVPNNLRDFPPQAPSDKELDLAGALVDSNNTAEALKILDGRRDKDNALHLFYRARCLEAQGKFKEARRLYIQAKDSDAAFLRTRSAVNDAIRRARGKDLRVLDMEEVFARYAHDGVPGNDLFVDYCHMKIPANKLMAREIARFHVSDLGLDPSLAAKLDALPLRRMRKSSISLLYWLKIVKWSQYRLLPSRLRRDGPDAGVMIRGYRDSLRDLDTIDSELKAQRWEDY